MSALSFRNSKIVYYGPHPCDNCGITICKAGPEYGGSSFTYPSGPLYPNTEWSPHFCNPQDVFVLGAKLKRDAILPTYPESGPALVASLGYVILCDRNDPSSEVISANQTYGHSEWDAWSSAWERHQNNWPSWRLDGKLVLKTRASLSGYELTYR
jgi:hypothetical protein